MKRVGVLGALMMGALLVVGCDDRDPTRDTAPPARIRVVATAYPLADVARQVGGRIVELEWIAEGGQSIAAVQLTPQLQNRLRRADLIYTGGSGEPWAIEGVDDPFRTARFVRLDTLPAAQGMAHQSHLWLDPVLVRESIDVLTTRLVELRPKHERELRAAAGEVIRQLDVMLEDYGVRAEPRDAAKPRAALLVLSRQWDALLARVEIEPVWEFDAIPTRLTDQQFRRLRRLAEQRGATALIVDVDTPATIAGGISDRMGLPVIRLDALGTSAPAGRSTYLQLMRYNLEELKKAQSSREAP